MARTLLPTSKEIVARMKRLPGDEHLRNYLFAYLPYYFQTNGEKVDGQYIVTQLVAAIRRYAPGHNRDDDQRRTDLFARMNEFVAALTDDVDVRREAADYWKTLAVEK